ncbi:MAG: hypothetical protein IH630_06740 [Thermoplasmata archaeon]|nr:hypothetical protein [Thermoplasmata archaeon]MCJ7562888.1 hypothetical protein [Thermoplasmata archaeon]
MLAVELLIGSIRSFGGALSGVPLLLFTEYGRAWPSLKDLDDGVRILPLTVPDSIRGYELAEKVCARAETERRVHAATRAII